MVFGWGVPVYRGAMSEAKDKAKILVQLDTDDRPSVFDQVVAVDAGVDHLLSHGGVTPDNVEAMVHGAIFTRGPKHLHNTALFIGGGDVSAGEAVLERVTKTFFGPMRVSVMLDANGANTTAVAAVLCAIEHVQPAGATALVLGGTGPVGQRAALLLAKQGATVRLASRSLERASAAADRVNDAVSASRVEPVAPGDDDALRKALEGVELVISAGAAGVTLLSADVRRDASSLQLAIDLNAVPPVGIEGVEPMDKAEQLDGVTAYGALGVGGRKMKIHKAALSALFDRNDLVLDAQSIYDLAVERGL